MRKAILSVLAAAALGCVPSVVSAQVCDRTAPDLYDSGDLFVMNQWGCNSTHVNFFWDAYDFDTGDWDQGFGYPDMCNISLPLARTFNALWVLHYAATDFATSISDRNGSVLRWGGSYAR